VNVKVCAQCGERNEAAAEFCVACLAFLPWSADDPQATVIVPATTDVRAEPSEPDPVRPLGRGSTETADATLILEDPVPDHSLATGRAAGDHALPAGTTPTIRASVDTTAVTLSPDGSPTVVTVSLFNGSSIVDGFVVELLRPPPWLDFRPVEERLMPNATAELAVHFRAAPGSLPPAGRFRLDLRVRSAADRAATVPLPVDLTVPPNNAPLALIVEPAVVRVRDTTPATLTVVVDNTAGNQERRVALRGSDPERVVRFGFRPPAVDVAPGGRAHVLATVTGPQPEPGREVSRPLTVSVDGPGRPVTATATLVQTAAPPPVDVPYEVELTPSLLRARDSGVGYLRVVIDNRQGAARRRVRLSGTDPESTMHFVFDPPVVDVERGGHAEAGLRLQIALPAPGVEVNRPFTVTGWDGTREVTANGSFVITTSPPPPDRPPVVRLDPSVLRVRDTSWGGLVVIADNRGGSRPRTVRWGAYDAERVMRFEFHPDTVMVGPGQAAGARLRVWAPRAAGGEQVTRAFTVVAADGVAEVEATGSFVQEFSDRRPLWRTLLTMGGGALAIVSAFLPWHVGARIDVPDDLGVPVGREITGLEWGLPAVEAGADNAGVGLVLPDLPDELDPFLSGGALLIVLAALAMFGRIGTTGRLTRLSALVVILLLAAFLVVASMVPGTGRVGSGAFLALVAGAAMFAGGVLARPRR
jgi:hypothetical protein